MSLVEGTRPSALGALSPPPAHISASQVTKLVGSKYSCPRAYGYQYLAGVSFTVSPPLLTGRAVDAGLNAWFVTHDADIAQRALEDDWLAARAEWEAGGGAPDDLAPYEALSLTGLRQLIAYHGDLQVAAVQTEHRFSFSMPEGEPGQFVGYSDRIDLDGTIVDHKWTGTKPWGTDGEWSDDWLDTKLDQLIGYHLAREAECKNALVSGGPTPLAPLVPNVKLVVAYGRKGGKTIEIREYPYLVTGADKRRVLERLREAEAMKRSGFLPARPGDACARCSSQAQCRTDFANGVDPFPCSK